MRTQFICTHGEWAEAPSGQRLLLPGPAVSSVAEIAQQVTLECLQTSDSFCSLDAMWLSTPSKMPCLCVCVRMLALSSLAGIQRLSLSLTAAS